MGLSISPDTIKTLQAIRAQESLSVAETAAELREPLAEIRTRMHNMAGRGLIVGELDKGAGKQYSLTPEGHAVLGLKPAPVPSEFSPEFAVAGVRSCSYGQPGTWTPQPWNSVRPNADQHKAFASRGDRT